MKKTSNFKKILSVVLALMMVMTTFVLIPMTASAEAITPDTSWQTANSGTSWEDAYIIDSPEDLAGWMAAGDASANWDKGTYFKLGADIDMAGYAATTIYYAALSSWDNMTALHLDGQNYTIRNLNIESGYGFVSAFGAGSEIKNLHFVNFDLEAATAMKGAGLLAGESDAENVTISNVSFDENSSVTSKDKNNIVAGFIGWVVSMDTATSTPSAMTFEYCVNAAEVQNLTGAGTGTVGGFIGRYWSNKPLVMNYCVNKGNVTLTHNVGAIGGFVGKQTNYAATLTFNHCYNSGTLTQTTTNNGGMSAIVGQNAIAGTVLNLTACYDTSKRTVDSTNFILNTAIGVGYASKQMTLTMTDCFAAVYDAESAFTCKYPNQIYNPDVTAGNALTAIALDQGSSTTSVTNSLLVADAETEITLGDTTKSTIAAEMAKIDREIAKKSIKDVQIDISTVGARIGLTDPYGFMLITDIQDVGGNTVSLADVAEYGFYFLEAAPEQSFTAEQIVANENAVEAEGEAYNGSTTEFASAYAALSAAKLDATVYFVAYATMSKGGVSQTYYSQVRSASPLTFVEDFKDGYMYGAEGDVGAVAIANPKEVAVYGTMYQYHKAYVAYDTQA